MWISVGINSEGIYRLSGNKTRIQKLILLFNQGQYIAHRTDKKHVTHHVCSLDAKGFIVDPDIYLVNDVAGALKQFFRSLPDPLLTHHLYAAFINAVRK